MSRDNGLAGGPGDDVVSGGAGDDIPQGGPGDDRVSGDGGDDVVWGDAGRDRLSGGSGRDFMISAEEAGGSTPDAIDCGVGPDEARSDSDDTLQSGCESLIVFSNGLRVGTRPAIDDDSADFSMDCYGLTACDGAITLTGPDGQPLGAARFQLAGYRGRGGQRSAHPQRRGRAAPGSGGSGEPPLGRVEAPGGARRLPDVPARRDAAGAPRELGSRAMAKTERSTDIAKPPEEVFPYLFEADKVPQWTTGLHSYERLDGGALGKGSKFRENLEVSGQKIDAELEITAFDPPHRAESRTEIRGIDVISTYELTPSGSGTRLTQTIEASGGGLKGRVLIPVIQPHLEKKLDADLAALRALLA